MPELQICLLGSFEVAHDFAPVSTGTWRNPFASKVLKLVLVRRPAPVPAQEAVRLVGGGMVLADLAPAVEHIRRVLQPAAAVQLENGWLRFAPGPHCWIDVDAFEAHYRAGVSAAQRGDMLPAILALQEADALYQGDLLEEVQEPWVQESRKRLQAKYIDILDRLAEGHAVLSRYQDAVGFCHKALSHDSQRETTYQRMMVYYYYLGDLGGAAEAYRACQDALGKVSRETDELWERLSRHQLPSKGALEAAPAIDPDPNRA